MHLGILVVFAVLSSFNFSFSSSTTSFDNPLDDSDHFCFCLPKRHPLEDDKQNTKGFTRKRVMKGLKDVDEDGDKTSENDQSLVTTKPSSKYVLMELLDYDVRFFETDFELPVLKRIRTEITTFGKVLDKTNLIGFEDVKTSKLELEYEHDLLVLLKFAYDIILEGMESFPYMSPHLERQVSFAFGCKVRFISNINLEDVAIVQFVRGILYKNRVKPDLGTFWDCNTSDFNVLIDRNIFEIEIIELVELITAFLEPSHAVSILISIVIQFNSLRVSETAVGHTNFIKSFIYGRIYQLQHNIFIPDVVCNAPPTLYNRYRLFYHYLNAFEDTTKGKWTNISEYTQYNADCRSHIANTAEFTTRFQFFMQSIVMLSDVKAIEDFILMYSENMAHMDYFISQIFECLPEFLVKALVVLISIKNPLLIETLISYSVEFRHQKLLYSLLSAPPITASLKFLNDILFYKRYNLITEFEGKINEEIQVKSVPLYRILAHIPSLPMEPIYRLICRSDFRMEFGEYLIVTTLSLPRPNFNVIECLMTMYEIEDDFSFSLSLSHSLSLSLSLSLSSASTEIEEFNLIPKLHSRSTSSEITSSYIIPHFSNTPSPLTLKSALKFDWPISTDPFDLHFIFDFGRFYDKFQIEKFFFIFVKSPQFTALQLVLFQPLRLQFLQENVSYFFDTTSSSSSSFSFDERVVFEKEITISSRRDDVVVGCDDNSIKLIRKHLLLRDIFKKDLLNCDHITNPHYNDNYNYNDNDSDHDTIEEISLNLLEIAILIDNDAIIKFIVYLFALEPEHRERALRWNERLNGENEMRREEINRWLLV